MYCQAVSPRPADPAIRAALIEAGARILAVDGPGALSTRRLATETGTSTMAVYTYFGSMDGLRRAIRAEGFARLAGRFDSADPSLAVPWAGEIWTMRHGMVTLALTGLLPTQQIRFLLADMTYRLVVGYGDTPSVARHSVEKGMRDQAAHGSAGQRRLLAERSKTDKTRQAR